MYLITGPSHLANVVVSIRSLRRFWSGDVLLFAWPESYDIAVKIAHDPGIRAIVLPCQQEYRRKNAQEIHKLRLIQELLGYDMVIYLDADTIIAKPIDPIGEAAEAAPDGLSATQFCGWKMHQNTPKARVSRMLGIDGIDQDMVRKSLHPDMVSYNSGIFAARPDSPALPDWVHWTELAKGIYISGECALHPIAQKYRITTLYNGVYNNSPNHQSRTLPDGDVAIWHFHGDCNTRPDKSPRGVAIWTPEFFDCFDKNVAQMRDWVRSIGNDYLNQILNARETATP